MLEGDYEYSVQYTLDSLKAQIKGLQDMVDTPGSFSDFVPDAPPFQEIELVFSDQVNEGCAEIEGEIEAYIITYPNELSEGGVIFQKSDGTRFRAYVRGSSNFDDSWIPLIFIPGQRVRLKLQSCGNGGINEVMAVKTLSR